jgi:hypothetical protein
MLGIWLFFGIFGLGIGIVLAGRAAARGAADLEAQQDHRRVTWE